MSDTAVESKPELSFLESLKILFGASRAFWLVNMVNFGDGIAYFGILTLLTRFLGTRLGMPDISKTFSLDTPVTFRLTVMQPMTGLSKRMCTSLMWAVWRTSGGSSMKRPRVPTRPAVLIWP